VHKCVLANGNATFQSRHNHVDQLGHYWSDRVCRARTDLPSETGRNGPIRADPGRARSRVREFWTNLAHVNVLGKEIACWAALHLTRMIGRELSLDHVVRPRDCDEANPHRRGPLAWLRQRSRRAVSETSLQSLWDAICQLQMPRFKQSNHDSFGGPSRQRLSNHAWPTDLYPYSDPITCTCSRRQDTAWGAPTVAEAAPAAALHRCDHPAFAPSATKTRVAPQAAAETRGDSLLALSLKTQKKRENGNWSIYRLNMYWIDLI